MEVVKKGVDTKEVKFIAKCSICECEFKYCLEAVKVVRYGDNNPELYLNCPECHQVCNVDVGKYQRLLLTRVVIKHESDF